MLDEATFRHQNGQMSIHAKIESLIQSNDVVLFMKGSRHFPQCGFSSAVVSVLNGLGVKYETVNVLSDPELREGIKTYSNWPTIPQLYIRGEFIGGSDIVREMVDSGELQNKLGVVGSAAAQISAADLSITLTPEAERAFVAAWENRNEHLRISVNSGFETDLFFDDPKPNDLSVRVGEIPIVVDPADAPRVKGLHIDYLTKPVEGFRMVNPNEPPAVRPLHVGQLKAMADRNEAFYLFDVRTEEERAIANISFSTPLDASGIKKLESLPKDTVLVFQCHHGVRSRAAAERALALGFRRIFNLEGGIDAWSEQVDPTVPRY